MAAALLEGSSLHPAVTHKHPCRSSQTDGCGTLCHAIAISTTGHGSRVKLIAPQLKAGLRAVTRQWQQRVTTCSDAGSAAAPPMSTKKMTRQRCKPDAVHTCNATGSPDLQQPSQHAHHIGVHHCCMLTTSNGRYGCAGVGPNACGIERKRSFHVALVTRSCVEMYIMQLCMLGLCAEHSRQPDDSAKFGC